MVVEKEERGFYTPTFPIAQGTEAAAFGDRMYRHRVDWLEIEHPRSIVQFATAINTVGLMVDILKSFAKIGLKSDVRSVATQTANHNHLWIAGFDFRTCQGLDIPRQDDQSLHIVSRLIISCILRWLPAASGPLR